MPEQNEIIFHVSMGDSPPLVALGGIHLEHSSPLIEELGRFVMAWLQGLAR